MPPKCPARNIRGSGYVKPDVKPDGKMEADMKKMLETRAQQDKNYFPETRIPKDKVDESRR